MSAPLPGARGWAASLALHGLLLAGVFLLTRSHAVPPPPLRWEVALVAPAPSVPPQVETKPQLETKPRTKAQTETRQATEPERKAAVDDQPAPAPRPPPEKAAAVPAAEPVRPAAPLPALPPALPPAAIVAAEAEVRPKPAPAVATMAAITPAPADRPVVAPPPARPDIDTQRRWQALLAAKLRELKRYPSLSRRLGQEGVVVLEARIQTDGRAAANVKRSSGYAALDRAAVKLFEEAIAALTGQLAPRDESLLEIPVAYRLES